MVGTNLYETALANAWVNMVKDIEEACAGETLGRRIELESRSHLYRIQMWLEPTTKPGHVVLSLHPEGHGRPITKAK